MTIEEALVAMRDHSINNPTHGHDCACKDKWVRLIRSALPAGTKRELMLASRYING